MRAAANTPGQSVYELTATVDAAVITALRIEVSPANAEVARHTPEDGFIVDQTDAWVIQPNGHRDKIPFRYFISDSEENLQAAVARQAKLEHESKSELGVGGFAANPNLFRARWIVGVPASPLRLSRGSRLKVNLTQTQNVTDKPALVKRARLAASADPNWSVLVQGHDFGAKLDRLTTLTRQLSEDSERRNSGHG